MTALGLLAVATLLSGCASVKTSYAPPDKHKVVTNKVVNTEFDAAWNTFVKELSGSFFVVNNIDKNSRFINISFSSNEPGKYVDCGRVTNQVENAHSSYNTGPYYPVKAAVITEIASSRDGIPLPVRIQTRPQLEGRINVYMAPEQGKTEAKVTVRYVFNMMKRPSEPIPASFQWLPNPVTESFNSNTGSNGDLTCVATGELERELLDMIR